MRAMKARWTCRGLSHSLVSQRPQFMHDILGPQVRQATNLFEQPSPHSS